MSLTEILAGLIAEEQPDITPEQAEAKAKAELSELMAEIDAKLSERADLEEYGQLVYEADALEHLYTV